MLHINPWISSYNVACGSVQMKLICVPVGHRFSEMFSVSECLVANGRLERGWRPMRSQGCALKPYAVDGVAAARSWPVRSLRRKRSLQISHSPEERSCLVKYCNSFVSWSAEASTQQLSGRVWRHALMRFLAINGPTILPCPSCKDSQIRGNGDHGFRIVDAAT